MIQCIAEDARVICLCWGLLSGAFVRMQIQDTDGVFILPTDYFICHGNSIDLEHKLLLKY